MNYLGQLFWRNSTIGYGCLVLLGTVSTAGVVELEIKNQFISSWFEKVAAEVQRNMQESSSSDSSSHVTTSQVLSPFTWVGQQVSTGALAVWPILTGAFDIFKSLKTDILMWLGGIKSFLTSLFKSEIINMVFKNIHQKFWQLLTFLVVGADGARDQFFGLFKNSKKDKTLQAGKLLLGLENNKNKNFKAKPEVFHFLLLNWLEDPKKVTGKFDRLSESVDKLLEKLKKSPNGGSEGSGGGSSDSQDPKYVYELDVKTTKEYLETVEGLPEKIYNSVWSAEIFSKITEGIDITNRAKSFVSMVGSFFPF